MPLNAYQVSTPEVALSRVGSPYMRGMFDAASFPVPQGQPFPGLSGMRGYFAAANFPVPQGQPWPGGPVSAKVVAMPSPGVPSAKVKGAGQMMSTARMRMVRPGMNGQYAGAVWSKAPYFAGCRGNAGLGQTFTADLSTLVSAFTTLVTDSPGTSAAIALGLWFVLLRKK